MEHIEKIKALQIKAGIEPDGVVNSKTWLNVYYLLFGAVPYDINTRTIIKAIQQKIGVRVDGYPWYRIWNVLYDQLIVNDAAKCQKINKHNQQILENMPKEVVPFAKQLICLAAERGIKVKIANDFKNKQNDAKSTYKLSANSEDFVIYNFGLAFNVTIIEASTAQDIEEKSTLYSKLAKLGESIGLTCINGKNIITDVANFVLRPAWAVRMKEYEMLQELDRRKREDINLLSIL